MSSVAAEATDRSLGVVHTPKEVVDFMVNLSSLAQKRALNILEPACGLCPFLSAVHEKRKDSVYKDHYVGVEVNPKVVELVLRSFPAFHIVQADFLLWNTKERFDRVIGNPPYGIIGDPSHYPISFFRENKRVYKRMFLSWRGKYNIYGAFIEKGLRLLKSDGRLVFIVPGTFMFLDDFSLLRKYMSQQGSVSVHYLGSVFPKKNVVAVVLVVQKGARGLEVWERDSLVCREPDYHGELIRFETPESLSFEQGKVPLGDLFHIHFAARSPEIRKHPLTSGKPSDGSVPVLTGRNLKAGWIDYESNYSGYWFPHQKASILRPFYGFPHIVVAHTKGSKVVSALDEKCYPWREEFHLVARKTGLALKAIVDYLNSEPVQKYLKVLYRDVSPHLTTRMLEALPLPMDLCPKEEKIMTATLYGEEESSQKSIFAQRNEILSEAPSCDLLTSYETFLKSIDLEGYRQKYQRIKTVEQDLPKPLNPLPPIYNAYWLTSKYPSFEEFFSWYWSTNPKDIMDFFQQYFWGCSIEFVRLGFEARLYRTWVSLLTQFHLGYLWNCIHPGTYNSSAELDMSGIDAVLTEDRRKLAVQVKKISYRREASQRRFSKKKLEGFSGVLEIPYTIEDPDEILRRAQRARSERTKREFEALYALTRVQHYLPNGFVIFTSEYVKHLCTLISRHLTPGGEKLEIGYKAVVESLP